MSANSLSVRAIAAGLLVWTAGCSGFRSNQPAMQVYTLDPVFTESTAATASTSTTLQVLRPQAAPGLDTERIALRRSAQRLDYYAGSRWPAPLPEFVQSLAVEALRASGKFHSVHADTATFAADEVLQIEIRRWQAEYAGDNPPVVHVQLLATLGRRADRGIVASVSADSSVTATENRMQAVVAAFQSAATAALSDLAGRLSP
jgi:cholesterol transport system auxiliary component